MKTRHPFVEVALQYAEHGAHVLPVHTPVDGRCTCGRADCKHVGKHPRTEHGVDDATTDPKQIELWSELYPNANIGIAAKPSGLVIPDIDARKGGLESLAELELQHGPFPLTPEDRSGSGGGSGHRFYRRPGENITGASLAPGVEVIANGFVVVPYSIHESGNFYTWLHRLGKTSIADLPDWVIERLVREERGQLASEIERTQFFDGRVPRLAWQILTGKADLSRFAGDRSSAEFSAILSMVGKGFDFAAVRDAFEAWAHPNTKYIEKRSGSRHEAERWLRMDFDAAVKWSRTHESKGHELGRTHQTWALSTAWPGRTGATDRANYLAHCKIAEQCGHIEYAASTRTLAEIAGINPRTVSASNKRLAKRGLIELVRGAVRGAELPNTWSLKPQETRGSLSAPPLEQTPTSRSGVCTRAGHDAFRRDGLGKSAGQIFDLLAGSGRLTMRQITQATGRHRVTVKVQLKALEAAGAVERDATPAGLLWSVVQGADLDKIADGIRTRGDRPLLGAGARQRERHKAERAHHREELDRGRVKVRIDKYL